MPHKNQRVLKVGSLVIISDIWDKSLDTWVDYPSSLAVVLESYCDEGGNNMVHLHIPGADYMYNIPYYDNELRVLWQPR